MKKIAKSILGVTLLEIMLVLAIAAMIIVMSVRYYQSATTNQQANSLIAALQVIISAADSLAQGSGAYSATSITAATLTPIVGASTFTAPWGGTINIGTVTSTTIPFTFSATMPAGVCALFVARMAANNHWTSVGCTGTTYITNP